MESKEIRVYGTLVNHTTIPADGDRARVDSGHNDSIAYAYQLYDQRFGASPSVQNYQDNINKRVKGITYDPSTGRTSVTGDLYVAGDLVVNGNVSGISLDDLDDVNTSGQASGKYLKYDGIKWIPAYISANDIAEFDGFGSGSEGQVIKYIDGKWRPGTDSGGASTLNELTDVTISSPTTGQTLRYNGSNWTNSKLGLGDLSDLNTAGAQDGDVLIYDATAGKWKPGGVSLTSIINRIATLEGLWTDNGTTLTAKSGRSVTGAGFYDSTMS